MSERENIERKLYEACLSGSVAELDALIEKDQLILDRVSSFTYFFNDTPLHVAVLRGHLDLTKALLTRNSKLAFELDLSRCSPLHIASTKGHVEIVRELLRVNSNACLARDQDGRIPLHLAAMKGRVEVIQELLQSKPESIREKLDKGETVLHLCVKYNRLEALKTLIKDLDGNELLNSGDDNGNTILHLAAALKQMDTIKHLLGIKNVKEHCMGIKNCNGSTVLDIVEHCPNRDLKTIEIRELLLQPGVRKSICDGSNPESRPNDCTPKSIVQSMKRLWKMYFDVDPLWLKEVRGHLITAATLTATMAYQAILSPPGGVWQDDEDGQGAGQAILNDHKYILDGHKAGQAVLDSVNSTAFLGINSVVLFTSLCTIMLALSGFSNQNKFLLRLVFTLHITLAGMAFAYGFAILAVFPFNAVYNGTMSGLLLALGGVIGFLLLVHVCHFLGWLRKKSPCRDGFCGRRSCFNCIPNYC